MRGVGAAVAGMLTAIAISAATAGASVTGTHMAAVGTTEGR